MRKLRESKFLLVAGSLIGAIFIILGCFSIFSSLGVVRDIVVGFLYICAGLIIFPPFDLLLEKKLNLNMPGWLNGLLFLLFMIVAEII